jgi:hypothetical protein
MECGMSDHSYTVFKDEPKVNGDASMVRAKLSPEDELIAGLSTNPDLRSIAAAGGLTEEHFERGTGHRGAFRFAMEGSERIRQALKGGEGTTYAKVRELAPLYIHVSQDRAKVLVRQIIERAREADKKPRENGGHRQPPPPQEPQWKQGSFTAEQLQGVKFTPVSFLVKDIIPAEGVTLLCSKPKFGKSWLVYEICIGCTTNRMILGELLPAQGDVLYLALEDSARRLQHRMKKLLPAGAPWPAKLTLKTEWRRLHEGGLDDIRGWFEHTKEKGGNPAAVAIDVLAKVRKPTGRQQLYEADYAALADLTKLANELGIAIIVVHHTRKMAADDLMETVSGSYGVSGAVDTVLVMANKGSGAVLDARGRDLESRALAIEFNNNTCRWRILGTATEVHLSAQRARVLAALQDAAEGLPVAEIKVAAELPTRNAADVLLYKMTNAGEIERVKRGVYRLPAAETSVRAEEDRKDQ